MLVVIGGKLSYRKPTVLLGAYGNGKKWKVGVVVVVVVVVVPGPMASPRCSH